MSPASALPRFAGLLLFVAATACSDPPGTVSVEMATDRVSRAFVDRAIDEFRRACSPLFTTHVGDVSDLAAVATDETSTVIRRFGWGVHLALTMKVATAPTTLAGLAEPDRRADFLIGGGDRPGFTALSPTAARLCDLTPAPGRSQVFRPVPALAELLPRLRYAVTDEQRGWWADEMRRALSGDYQSQRNVAWCYFDGCYGVKPIDDVEACAWRLVILAARNPKSDASDAENVALDCRANLSPAEQGDARGRAEGLFRRIYGRPLPTTP